MREEDESLEQLIAVEASLHESSGQGVTNDFCVAPSNTHARRQPAMFDLNEVLLVKQINVESCQFLQK